MSKLFELEVDVEDEVCAAVLRDFAVFSIKLKRTNEVGAPDRIFLIPGGRPLFIEFKRAGEKPRPRQVIYHKRLVYHGYDIEAHDTFQGAYEAVRRKVEAAAVHAAGR